MTLRRPFGYKTWNYSSEHVVCSYLWVLLSWSFITKQYLFMDSCKSWYSWTQPGDKNLTPVLVPISQSTLLHFLHYTVCSLLCAAPLLMHKIIQTRMCFECGILRFSYILSLSQRGTEKATHETNTNRGLCVFIT